MLGELMKQQNVKEYKFNSDVIKKKNENVSFFQIMRACNVTYGNILRIKRKKLIIIFVPGIMASRLVATSHKMIWDPDSIKVMREFFGLKPEDRQELLLTDPPLSIPKKSHVYLPNTLKKYPYALDRGWHTISWKYYGTLIENLDKWTTQIKSFIDMKIYAFGYNWLQSNEISGNELNEMLNDLVAQEKRRSEDVKVLLISHSIGGLVVRECINKMDDMGLISGLIWKIGKYLIISGCDARLIPAQNEQEIGEIRRSISEMEEYNYMCYRYDNIDRFPYIYSTISQNDTFHYLQDNCPICLDEHKILYNLCQFDKYKTHKSPDNIFFSHDDIKKIKFLIKNRCFDWSNIKTV